MCVPKCYLIVGVVLLATACKKENFQSAPVNAAIESSAATALITTTENFESGTKTTYPAANVVLSTGTWNFKNALLGRSALDRKNGLQSARIKGSGKLTMRFDHAGGASTVSVTHARYGADANGTWQLWYSTNGGANYTQAGATVTTSSTSLQAVQFTINIAGNIRFEIRKTDAGTNKINIDDFIITDYATAGPKKFLFDATKAETAGNADWVIDEDGGSPQRTPSPAQSGITATTAENYWTGAISSWGIALVKTGNAVETLPVGAAITYGNTSNQQDLSHYDVFVVDEPNIVFTAAEKTAILNFVSNGGGLFMVADHTSSDRNSDGWDSPEIWNDLMTNNGIINNPFGFSIALANVSEVSSNVLNNSTNPILHGSQGNVTQMEFNNGSTITLNSSANPTVQGLIWQKNYSQGTTHVMCASSTYGSGRVYVVSDSSPMDDGTGYAGNTLYVSWTLYSHAALFMNASLWLAKLQ